MDDLAALSAAMSDMDMDGPIWVRASVVQASTIFGDTPATMEKAMQLIAEAAALGAQLIVFPEAFIGGYPRGSAHFSKHHACAIDIPGPEVDRLAAAAGRFKVHLVMGAVERCLGTLFSSILYFNSQGVFLGKHRKRVPTAADKRLFAYGDGSTPVFETDLGQLGGLVSWENRMPLLRNEIYAKGVEIYCAPTAECRESWQATLKHITVEGGCFVLSSNQFCRRRDYPPSPEYVFAASAEEEPSAVICPGGSVIISPSGKILAGPHYDGEAIISAHLDMGEIHRAKAEFDVVGHKWWS